MPPGRVFSVAAGVAGPSEARPAGGWNTGVYPVS